MAVSLLSVVSVASAADLSPSCEKYFQSIDKYMDMASKSADMKGQMDMLKQQYAASKEQLSKLPADSQEQGCKPALEAMEQAMKQLENMK